MLSNIAYIFVIFWTLEMYVWEKKRGGMGGLSLSEIMKVNMFYVSFKQ